jgi:hypothetical protein
MAKKFVISRFAGGRRLVVCWGDFRTEYLEDDPKSLKRCLGFLNLNPSDPKLLASLQEALERFYRLEARSLAKFGPPKMFRIWRVDPKTVQIELKGGYTELRGQAKSDATLKRCLEEMFANPTLLPELKRELAEFLRNEKTKG